MARVFSGIQPSGDMHLGNYLGAVRRWVDSQPAAGSDAARNHDAIFCVVDLHAMTLPWDPAELTAGTRRLATLLAAAGLGGDRSLLFVQSHVRAHAELTWLLNCVATYGELQRMTQWKDKSARGGEAGIGSASAGLFDYPVLMVSDILLYDTAEVPVGDDQRQHVELARDVAIRFNSRFGDTFVVPKAVFPSVGARVMDLQRPERKMSKSEDSPQGTILVLDRPRRSRRRSSPRSPTPVPRSATTATRSPASRTSSRSTARSPAARSPRSNGNSTGEQYGVFKVDGRRSRRRVPAPGAGAVRTSCRAIPAEVDRRLALGADAAESIAEPVLQRASRAGGPAPAPAV